MHLLRQFLLQEPLCRHKPRKLHLAAKACRPELVDKFQLVLQHWVGFSDPLLKEHLLCLPCLVQRQEKAVNRQKQLKSCGARQGS